MVALASICTMVRLTRVGPVAVSDEPFHHILYLPLISDGTVNCLIVINIISVASSLNDDLPSVTSEEPLPQFCKFFAE